MPGHFLHVEPRNFTSISAPVLSNEARDAVNAALKAMSSWRNDLVEETERNGKRAIDKMAEAAAALGWPEQVVDAARTQMQNLAEMQIETMDRVMDAWEAQLKSPNPTSSPPSAALPKLKPFPDFAAFGAMPGAEAFQKAAMNPMQFWTQFAGQNAAANPMQFWTQLSGQNAAANPMQFWTQLSGQNAATNPMQFWMQLAEQWQKPWLDMMTSLNKGGRSRP
jgi:hypothetical protein